MSHTRPDLLDEAWRAGDPPGSENLLNDLKTAIAYELRITSIARSDNFLDFTL